VGIIIKKLHCGGGTVQPGWIVAVYMYIWFKKINNTISKIDPKPILTLKYSSKMCG